MHYTRTHTFLDGSSSRTTSTPYFVGDFTQMALSVTTQAASAVTVYGSASDGFTVALATPDWSVLTTILASGAYTVDPGVRWLYVERAAASGATVLLAGAVA